MRNRLQSLAFGGNRFFIFNEKLKTENFSL